MQINLQALCKQVGVELYDEELLSENGKKIYRIFITKSGGVNLQDCEALSTILSPILDLNPPCEGEYFLEVSSAGLERKLHKLEHFKLSIGELVQISTQTKEKFIAQILRVDADKIVFKNKEKGEFSLDFKYIKKAKTFVEW